MDAVKFLKEEDRMCDKYKYSSNHSCSDCPCHSDKNGTGKICSNLRKTHPEKYVEIVAKWASAHPKKTRQSEFLKMFPDAPLDEFGCMSICPADVDKNEKCGERGGAKCVNCQKNYWLEEVD